MLPEAGGQAWSAFFSCLPYEVSPSMESRWFAAGCFHCLWEAGSERMPMGKVLYRLKDSSGSLERRIAALFDLRWESDGYLLVKLSRIIKMARQKGYAIDCAALLKDLLRWDDDSQSVQRRWAREMYQTTDITEEKGENH